MCGRKKRAAAEYKRLQIRRVRGRQDMKTNVRGITAAVSGAIACMDYWTEKLLE
jgi:hypothetical protein